MAPGPAAVAGELESRPFQGIMWMVLTSFLFVIMDTIAKSLTESYPVIQVTWARFTFHLVFVALLLNVRFPATLKTNRFGVQILRSIFMLATNFLFFWGLFWLALAENTAIM